MEVSAGLRNSSRDAACAACPPCLPAGARQAGPQSRRRESSSRIVPPEDRRRYHTPSLTHHAKQKGRVAHPACSAETTMITYTLTRRRPPPPEIVIRCCAADSRLLFAHGSTTYCTSAPVNDGESLTEPVYPASHQFWGQAGRAESACFMARLPPVRRGSRARRGGRCACGRDRRSGGRG